MTLAALAAVVLSSCSKNEIIPNTREENAVVFGAYSGTTKAAPITSTTILKDQGGFSVFAYYTGSADFSATATPNFMFNQNVTSTDGTTWTYSPVKYWPNNDSNTTSGSSTFTDKLSFFAYAPYVAAGADGATSNAVITHVTANTATGDPKVTYAIAANPANSIDLLYSDADLKNKTKQDYTITSKVTFTFKHALSRLEFLVQGAFDSITAGDGALDPATKIYVNSVKIQSEGISKTGVLNLNSGAWELGAVDASFEPAVNVPDDLKSGGTGVTASEAALHAAGEYFMLFPTASAVNYNFIIDYDVITTDTALDGEKSQINNKITKTASIKFEAGKAYKVKLVLGMTTVKLDADVADWTDASDQVIWMPINLS